MKQQYIKLTKQFNARVLPEQICSIYCLGFKLSKHFIILLENRKQRMQFCYMAIFSSRNALFMKISSTYFFRALIVIGFACGVIVNESTKRIFFIGEKFVQKGFPLRYELYRKFVDFHFLGEGEVTILLSSILYLYLFSPYLDSLKLNVIHFFFFFNVKREKKLLQFSLA